MRTLKSTIGSIVGGVAITLVTGLYANGGLIGSIGYGFPMVWLRRLVIAPQYNPWRVNATGLIVDIVIWFLIIELIYLAGCSWKHKSAPKKSSAKSTRKRKR